MIKSDVYKGKLGFSGQFADALSRATPIIIDTFEDHGHDVHTFVSRSAAAVSMDLDQFEVEVRHRPRMKRGWKAPQCDGDMLELRLAPLFPEVCDRELTEMLLAALLHNLVVELEAESVKWLDAPFLLTCNQFLSAFETIDPSDFDTPDDARVPEALPGVFTLPEPDSDDFAYWDGGASAATTVLDRPKADPTTAPETTAVVTYDRTLVEATTPQPTRPRGRSVFEPVDVAVREIEHQCDEILMASHNDNGDTAGVTHTPLSSDTEHRRGLFSVGNILTLAKQPVAKALHAFKCLRKSELRYSLQILALTAVALYLHSAGMVRAAINLLQ
ncbi:hypothetical protein KMP13_16265 [Epibacterium ulvae]|uniref:hypothetical protein n=1 Tax=Epibacterium ulvae TaxID=1156985 RepID=UPI001BFCA9C2|nr:hypothetical protein [Epibacterium ulvae]MBT8155394.1 hypothetical protein [Epibacterium ulvae]